MFVFANVIGAFVFDNQLEVVEKILFRDNSEYEQRKEIVEKLKHKHNASEPAPQILKKILLCFKSQENAKEFYAKNLEITSLDVKNSVTQDILLSHAVNNYEEIERNLASLSKRLREWYELYCPEASIEIIDNEKFASKIATSKKEEILTELKKDQSIGADFNDNDLKPILEVSSKIISLYDSKKMLVEYMSNVMDKICPNIKVVCGTLIGAKLIEHAGSLRRLSEMPASTVQILGAETALFRHLKTGAKPPRHGLIVNHPLISKAPEKLHGKIARALADKISIAAKVDYFKGKFVGDRLNEQLMKKMSNLK